MGDTLRERSNLAISMLREPNPTLDRVPNKVRQCLADIIAELAQRAPEIADDAVGSGAPPEGANADEWLLHLAENIDALPMVAVQICSAIERAEQATFTASSRIARQRFSVDDDSKRAAGNTIALCIDNAALEKAHRQ